MSLETTLRLSPLMKPYPLDLQKLNRHPYILQVSALKNPNHRVVNPRDGATNRSLFTVPAGEDLWQRLAGNHWLDLDPVGRANRPQPQPQVEALRKAMLNQGVILTDETPDRHLSLQLYAVSGAQSGDLQLQPKPSRQICARLPGQLYRQIR